MVDDLDVNEVGSSLELHVVSSISENIDNISSGFHPQKLSSRNKIEPRYETPEWVYKKFEHTKTSGKTESF